MLRSAVGLAIAVAWRRSPSASPLMQPAGRGRDSGADPAGARRGADRRRHPATKLGKSSDRRRGQADQRRHAVQHGAGSRRPRRSTCSGRIARPAPGAAVPDPGGLLRSRLRAAAGPPRGRAGGAQPDAPPGLPQVGVRRRLSAHSTPVCQFSFVCDGSLYRRPARRRLEGGGAGRARGARRLCRAARSAPRPIIMPIMSPRTGRRCWPRSRKIGAHIFYRWPGAWGSACGLHRPLCRRAQRSGLAAAAALSPGRTPDRRQRWSPVRSPTAPAANARAERRRRPARHLEGLDAQHSDAVRSTVSGARAIAEQQGPAAPAQNDAAAETRVIASR